MQNVTVSVKRQRHKHKPLILLYWCFNALDVSKEILHGGQLGKVRNVLRIKDTLFGNYVVEWKKNTDNGK